MSYRYTNTEKWVDAWFSNLKQIEMLLFIYLCDNCDIAGFIEVNFRRWANDLSSSAETIEGALKGLTRGLILSKDNDCVFIRNFLKHQKNLPLNESNKAHLGILRRFELYKHKFDIQDINNFIEGATKGLPSPTGIGIGKEGVLEENIDIPFQSVEFSEKWKEYTKFRSENGFPKYKPTGLKKHFSRLLKLCGGNEKTAIAIYDRAMANNYQGIFPLNGEKKQPDKDAEAEYIKKITV
jgi:hypothetical protein